MSMSDHIIAALSGGVVRSSKWMFDTFSDVRRELGHLVTQKRVFLSEDGMGFFIPVRVDKPHSIFRVHTN